MSKMMIYHAVIGAVLAVGASREQIWGVDMLAKTIDASNEQEVNDHKADGWHDHPQKVIDEEKARLMRENAELKTGNAKLANDEIAKLQAEKQALQQQIDELTAKLVVYEKAQDANKDGQVSFDEMTADQLKAYLDSKGIKYDKRSSKDSLAALANNGNEEVV